MAATPFLLRAPFLYPLAGLLFVLTRPTFLASVLLSAVSQLIIPLYWFSASLRVRSAARTFHVVLAARGVNALAVSDAERARLAAIHTSPPTRRVVRGGADVGPVRAVLLTMFTPAAPGLPFYVRWGKNLVVGPLTAAFPAGRALALLTDPADAALDALAAYLSLKRVRGPEIASIARTHAWKLRAFGVTAALLSAVPVASQLFGLTTAAGAALMAADLEAANRLVPMT